MSGMTGNAMIASRQGAGTATNNDSAPLWDSGGTVGHEYGRTNTERYIDNTLNVIESDGFGYSAMAGGMGYAAYTGGAAASAAGSVSSPKRVVGIKKIPSSDGRANA